MFACSKEVIIISEYFFKLGSNSIFPDSFFHFAVRIDDGSNPMYLVVYPLSDILYGVAHGVATVPLNPVEVEFAVVQLSTGV